MAKEIERKFILSEDWKLNFVHFGAPVLIRQGYLFSGLEKSCRIRMSVRPDITSFHLCVKLGSTALDRDEFEYSISIADGYSLFFSCEKHIEKIRYECMTANRTWHVDVFQGENKGLIIGEIEFGTIDDAKGFDMPSFCKEEVTENSSYLNVNLVEHPFSTWNKQ